MIISGRINELLWQTEKKLLKQFCIHSLSRIFVPVIIVDYERIAYVEEITNIRITLDKNISVSDNISDFLDKNYMQYPIQDKGYHVLEVKFDYILPSYIKHIITAKNLVQTSFSKYSLGRKKLQYMGR